MTTHKQLKTAAAELEKLATAIETSEREAATKLASAQAEAKTASETVKTASAADKAKLGTLAKTAATAIKKAGLLSTEAMADSFAAQILGDHATALTKMADLAGHVNAPKLGSVVVDNTQKPQTADEQWDSRASAATRKLNL